MQQLETCVQPLAAAQRQRKARIMSCVSEAGACTGVIASQNATPAGGHTGSDGWRTRAIRKTDALTAPPIRKPETTSRPRVRADRPEGRRQAKHSPSSRLAVVSKRTGDARRSARGLDA